MWLKTIPWLLAIRGVTFLPVHLYDGMWKYVSVRDLRSIVIGAASSSTALLPPDPRRDRGCPPTRDRSSSSTRMLIVCAAGRASPRLAAVARARPNARTRRVLIYGAGDAGEMLLREMLNGGDHERRPIGFVDDDPVKLGQSHSRRPRPRDQAGPPADHRRSESGRGVGCDAAGRAGRASRDRQGAGAVQAAHQDRSAAPGHPRRPRDAEPGARPWRVEDLLGRAPVGLDVEAARQLVTGKRILVTGAGGSIGSELSRQVLALGPSRLVLFERYENALWAVERSMAVQ